MPATAAPATPRNPALDARDARCTDWVRDIFLASPTPGRLAAADLARWTDHPGWRKAWTKRCIDATIRDLCAADLLRREDNGSWTMPFMVVLSDAGML